jgi:membrane dipeptidase
MRAQPGMPAWREERPWLQHQPICDGLLPWTAAFLPPGAKLADVLQRFLAAGVDHVSLTVAAGRDGALEALSRLGRLHREVAEQPDWLTIARGTADIPRARTQGKLSVAFHFQTATPLLEAPDLVPAFREAGVTRSILAYNEANAAGDGCHEPRNAGLSSLGKRLVAEMDACGMIVDLSHCGERTSLDAMDHAAQPPFYSHSNARALFDHERNLTDAQIRACAKRGGYIGVNGVGFFLGASGPDIPQAIARHLAYIADKVGAQGIGLGLDFMYLEGSDYGFFRAAKARWPRGYPNPPWDFLQPEAFGQLVAAIEKVGFGPDEVAGILGGNYLRSMEWTNIC